MLITDKRALKECYKRNPPAMGVYLITNILNGKKLIGASQNIPGMFNRIKSELKWGSFQNKFLLRDWQEQGEANFKFEVIDQLELTGSASINHQEELKTLLILWREKFPNCEYNC
jgi:hypothetical protein